MLVSVTFYLSGVKNWYQLLLFSLKDLVDSIRFLKLWSGSSKNVMFLLLRYFIKDAGKLYLINNLLINN